MAKNITDISTYIISFLLSSFFNYLLNFILSIRSFCFSIQGRPFHEYNVCKKHASKDLWLVNEILYKLHNQILCLNKFLWQYHPSFLVFCSNLKFLYEIISFAQNYLRKTWMYAISFFLLYDFLIEILSTRLQISILWHKSSSTLLEINDSISSSFC